jgi:hypothetical protein
MESDREKTTKMNLDVSTLLPHLNLNTDTDIHIYVLADTDIGEFGFHFHISAKRVSTFFLRMHQRSLVELEIKLTGEDKHSLF